MNRCIACNRLLSDKILELNHMPFGAQSMPSSEQLEEDKDITLCLYECSGCGLVQFDAPPIYYYRDVIRATRVSDKFRKLRQEQYEKFIRTFSLENKRILEVGCGGGEFLEIWKDYPVRAVGIENREELVASAKERGLDVRKGFIESENDILSDGPYDAFISFNFLEHQPNPSGMLRGIYENLTSDGVGLITVPSFDFFQEKAAYYEFLRDHIAYYSEDSMTRILSMNGFDVVEANRFNGDTLEVLVKKRKKTKMVDYSRQRLNLEKNINELLGEIPDGQGDIYVWGASHQAFTLLSTIHFDREISYIIDSAQFKWNKYSPASHIPITSPEILEKTTPACIIIMAPGFSDEIYDTICKKNNRVEYVITVIDGKIIKLAWGE